MNDSWTKVNFLSGHVAWMEYALQEDMLQVDYPNNFILDMGWYEKVYKIHIIKDFEWSNPVAQYTTQDAGRLFDLLTKAVKYIETELRKFCPKERAKSAGHSFEMDASVDGSVIGMGAGRTKKDAEQMAAKATLEKLNG